MLKRFCRRPIIWDLVCERKQQAFLVGSRYLDQKSKTRYGVRPCNAKRVSKEEAAAGEWAALLSEDPQVVDADGGISAEKLNAVCNKGVKLMLQEDTVGLLDFQGELNKIGQTFSEKENLQGAVFIYVLFKMCDNTLVDQTTKLEGVYLEAFRKVFDILEDSGWRLQAEGEEEEGEDGKKPSSLDDLPALSYMQEM